MRFMHKKGLTLLEILISTLILAITMTGLANLFFSAKRYILRSRSRMAAGELGKYFLDPLQMDIRQDKWGSNCLKGATGCPTAQTLNNITYTPAYELSDVPGTTLRKAKVTISWQEPSP